MKKRETIKQTDLSNRREKRKDNRIKSDPHMLHLKQPQEGIISLLLSSDQDAECIIFCHAIQLFLQVIYAGVLCVIKYQKHRITHSQENNQTDFV